MLIPPSVAEPVLPALSAQDIPALWPEPFAVKRTVVQKSIPLRVSEAEAVDTVTFTLLHPRALAAGVRAAVSVGLALSMLMPVCVAEAAFPALSAQEIVALCPEAWAVRVTLVQLLMPLKASVVPVKEETLTFALFQPKPFFAGV